MYKLNTTLLVCAKQHKNRELGENPKRSCRRNDGARTRKSFFSHWEKYPGRRFVAKMSSRKTCQHCAITTSQRFVVDDNAMISFSGPRGIEIGLFTLASLLMAITWCVAFDCFGFTMASQDMKWWLF